LPLPRLTALLGVAVLLVPSCSAPPEIRERADTVMGTLAELKVVSADPIDAERRLDAALATLSRIEALTSSYVDDSDVARLEAASPCSVSADTDAVLALSQDVTRLSGGAFDVTAGALVAAWGFPEHPHVPDSATVDEARSRVDPARLHHVGERVWAVDPGTEIDLGGVAKGWGVDRAADDLAGDDGACLVTVGGDLAVRGTKPDGRAWRIGIQDPRDPSRLFETLALSGRRAVATSGDYQRYVEVDGVRYHHLLDPRTGWPARGARSASVIAPTCALADAWATAAFVLGAEAGLAALEAQPDLEGILVTVDGDGELVRHETSGFAAYRSE